MLKKYLAIIAVVTIFKSLYAQGNWELMVPTPTSNQMVSLHFIDAWTGWSVGDYGTILKTGDGGNTWRIIEIPWLTDLTDVFFADAQTGYAVGKDGLVLKSTDGGESWTRQTIRYSNNLSRVRFRNVSQGWIIGEKGLILHTADGGSTWQQQISSSRENLLGMAFVGESGLCVVGARNTILLTADDGQSWQPVAYNSTGVLDFEDVFFLDPHSGWIAVTESHDGYILKTFDGGHHWDRMAIQSGEYRDENGGSKIFFGSSLWSGIQQVYFKPDLRTGLCLLHPTSGKGAEGNIPFFTGNGGKSWQVNFLDGNESSGRAGRFWFLTDTRVVNTGFQGDFRFSDDAGRSWYYPKPDQRNWVGFIVGKDGNIILANSSSTYYRSQDCGASWQIFVPQYFDSLGRAIDRNDINFTSVQFIRNPDTLWQMSSPSIFRSTDLGLTWYEAHGGVKEQPNPALIFRFLTPDTLVGYDLQCVNIAPQTFRSELQFSFSVDGGRSVVTNRFPEIWNDITPTDPQLFRTINADYFLDGQTGFLAGSDGNILKTTDTGKSWQNIYSGVVEELWDIEFIDRQTGFVVGEFGRILKTNDGGATWRKTNSGTQENIYSIAFKNPLEGWVGTENGLRYTTDGGETWHGVPLRYQHGLIRQISFDNAGNAYAFTLTYSLPHDLAFTRSGSYVYFLRSKVTDTGVVDTGAREPLPRTMVLAQNYPNPFNAVTRIRYHLPVTGPVRCQIFNLPGQLVYTLVDAIQPAGEHATTWDGRSADGKMAASGIYICLLRCENVIKTQKMLLLR